MNKQKLFFSYSRSDGTAFAQRLAADLQKRGFDVWIDQEDIKAGLKWDAEVEKALERCDCVLYLETEKSVVSNNVLDEVYYALEQNKKVIPLIVVDSKTPFRLKRLHHIDFTKDYERGLVLLVNELEDRPQAVSCLPEEKTSHQAPKKACSTKKAAMLAFIGGFVVLLTGAFFFYKKNESRAPAEKDAVILADTKTDTPSEEPNEETAATTEEKKLGKKEWATVVPPPANKKNKRERPNPVTIPRAGTGTTETGTAGTQNKAVNLNELVAGDWRLVSVEPKVKSHRGYLKIEALSENKANIKSYLQLYYPDSDASSYPTIFNAFAGCASCAINSEMKLAVEDIAVGSRTIKKLKEDQPDGRKAGEIIADINANKSLRGTVTLEFIDNGNAVIKVKQPQTVALSEELTLEPFVYIFRFRKND